jgi:hypothetical protein
MLSRSELARLIDGPALDREIERLGKMGGGWVNAATVLSRRINWTVDWANLGPEGSRLKVVSSRGEAVLFDDAEDSSIIVKLRGREENGFGSAGFGCILARDFHGRVEYAPGTLDQALERERLSWEAFGFSCRLMDVIEEEVGMLLAQDFIEGTAPTEKEIHAYMIANGWEWQRDSREVSPTLANHAWRKESVGAFDANETNFIKAAADGLIYPIDLIVWHWPQ